MPKRSRGSSSLYKIRSKVNSDLYYSSTDFPEKVIDGKVFIGIKKTPSDKTLFYMLKENVERCLNDN